MTQNQNINQKLIENISIILKKSLAADATLGDLRKQKKGNFEAIFKSDAVFSCSANTFQPYVEEVADDLLAWQNQANNDKIIILVKKIEQLFTVLANFEQSYNQ